jgi:hypothetical protein
VREEDRLAEAEIGGDVALDVVSTKLCRGAGTEGCGMADDEESVEDQSEVETEEIVEGVGSPVEAGAAEVLEGANRRTRSSSIIVAKSIADKSPTSGRSFGCVVPRVSLEPNDNGEEREDELP